MSAFAHLESSLFSSSELNVRGRRGLRDFIVDYRAVDRSKYDSVQNRSSTTCIFRAWELVVYNIRDMLLLWLGIGRPERLPVLGRVYLYLDRWMCPWSRYVHVYR